MTIRLQKSQIGHSAGELVPGTRRVVIPRWNGQSQTPLRASTPLGCIAIASLLVPVEGADNRTLIDP